MINQLQSVSKVIRAARFIALITFVFGSILMLWYYLNPIGGVIYLSLFYIISMFFLNSYFAVRLLQIFTTQNGFKAKILQTWGIMLLNIPVGYLYVQWGLEIYQNATPVY